MIFAKQSEAGFTRVVIQKAQLWRWRVVHFRHARRSDGKMIVPVAGDGVGWPDIFAVRGDRIIVAELKMGRQKRYKPTEEQEKWLDAFRLTGKVEVYLWTPDDWSDIERILE